MYHLFVELKLTHRLSRSYYNGIDIGYLTKDPAAYNDPNVCDPYITPQNQTTPPPQNQTIPQPQNQTTPKP